MGIDNQSRIDTARSKKDTADKAFQADDLPVALRSYYECLLYLKGLDNNTAEVLSAPGSHEKPQSKEKTEVNEILEKVHSNMSACFIKQGKWDRAIDASDKALKINGNNFKAMFRKGKALGELGFFDKSYTVLETLLEKNPADAPTINTEISRFKVKEKALDKASDDKMRGFLKNGKSPMKLEAEEAL